MVVNAAMLARTPFDGSDEPWDAGWDEMLRVNVLEPASLIREAVAHFRADRRRRDHHALELGGAAGSAIATLPAYAASKAAMQAVTQTVARNYAKEGVLAYVSRRGS